jgi:phosphonate transport system substrate-binding protein
MNRIGCIGIGIVAVLSIFETGCRSDNRYQRIDFSRRVAVGNGDEIGSAGKRQPLVVVISSIYSAQQSFSHYDELFAAVGRESSLPLRVTYCKNYHDAYRLFAEGKADIGLVSTALYIIGKRNRLLKALVVPVIDGKTVFQAFVIVHDPSPIRTFTDLKSGVFAFTDRVSLTGYLYPLSRSPKGLGFWKKTVFAGPHDLAVDLVQRGIVDGASVSSTVFNDIARNDPERTDHVRVIERSENFGIPPIVIRRSMPAGMETALRTAFTKLKSESNGWELLQILGIDTFTVTDDSVYASAAQLVPDTIVP